MCVIVWDTAGDASMAARFLTPAEAAEELRVSPDTILRLISSGELAALRVSLRIIRIPVPAFEAFRAGRKPMLRRVESAASRPSRRSGRPLPASDRQPA